MNVYSEKWLLKFSHSDMYVMNQIQLAALYTTHFAFIKTKDHQSHTFYNLGNWFFKLDPPPKKKAIAQLVNHYIVTGELALSF